MSGLRKFGRPRASSTESETKPLLGVSRRSSEGAQNFDDTDKSDGDSHGSVFPYIVRRAFSLDSGILADITTQIMEAQTNKGEFRSDIKNRQCSLVTIFAVWNTMMGTSLLTMPWGVERAGLVVGPCLVLLMGGLCLYTAYCNLRAHSQFGLATGDISELSRVLLGPVGENVAKAFSFIVLLGANIVYWILMSNFLYHSVNYIYGEVEDDMSLDLGNITINTAGVICPKMKMDNATFVEDSVFKSIWNLNTTVPLFLAILVVPLINFKSPTFFTKFNSFGTLSIMYLLIFVIVKASLWGVNLNINNPANIHYSPIAMVSFPATSGMLALSFFIHNIIITIMRSNSDQKNNGRDLTIAYLLVTLTYFTIGFLFYITFPLAKACIQDNLLDNFAGWDVMTVIARMFLLFQLVTVFPLIAYMLRAQMMVALTGQAYPKRSYVILFNAIVVTICILFAIFLPKIGTIIRFTGAISGMVHVFTLPCILRLAVTRKNEGKISVASWILHLAIPIFGAANLLGQFFVTDSTI